MTLTIPQKNDPIARMAVFALLALALWASFAPSNPTAGAQGIIILDATPTPSLPTPALALELAPVFSLPTPASLQLPAPIWPTEAPAAPLPPTSGDYLANVGAQEKHSPRGDVDHPPAYASGPILYPAENIILDPSAPATEPGVAVALPLISDAQAAVLGQRTSNGCARGELFYPRSGCHLPGSGGPMPGAVGE